MPNHPTLKELHSLMKSKRHQVVRWYSFRIVLGLASIWVGFVIWPLCYSMSLDISPLDAVRNGNVIVFVAVLCGSSLGLFLETRRAFSWPLATYHFILLIILLLIAAVHIPFFTLPQQKAAPKAIVFTLSAVLLIASVWVAQNTYLMTLWDQEPQDEEDERKAGESIEKAKQRTEAGGNRL